MASNRYYAKRIGQSFVTVYAVVTLSFVGTSLFGSTVIPFEFSLIIVGSGVGAFGTIPVLAFVTVGGTYLLTVGFLHALARLFGGTGSLDGSVQVVGYALAPLAFVFVPASLAGFQFLSALVALTALPLVLGIGVLCYLGTGELHDLPRSRAAGTVLGVAVLWALVAVGITTQIAAASAA